MAGRKPGRPKKTAGWVAPRQRILEAARELFYRHGIPLTGVDAVTARAGVAKMSLYAHFRSKGRLVAEYVAEERRVWEAWLDDWMAKGPPDPRARILHLFDGIAASVADPDYCGCAFIRAAAQLDDPDDPAFQEAVAQKAALRERLARLATDAGLGDPAAVGRELGLLIDGALVAAAMERSGEPVRAARAAAMRLLAAEAGPRRSRGAGRTGRA